jgi:uncharacterized protein YaiI (UPF0178 family)
MHIWVDADACPRLIKDVIFRGAKRTKVHVTLVSNQFFKFPSSEFISIICVPSGLDVADDYILTHMSGGDLVVTADIPLADGAVGKGGLVINPNGEEYTTQNIKDSLAARNLNQELRGGGLIRGGPAPFGNKQVQAFAKVFDRILARATKS